MKYIVYKITNELNNKIYVGVHRTLDINDRYMGSGKRIKRAIKKYGVENFSKEILYVFDNEEEMLTKEFEIVNETFIVDDNNYNIVLGGNVNSCLFTASDEERQDFARLGAIEANKNGANVRGSLKHLHLLETDETYRNRWLLSLKGNQKWLGKTHSEETKKQMSESHKGKHEGSKNSQFGTMWIHNLEEKLSKKIKKDELPEYENLGWLKGRKMNF